MFYSKKLTKSILDPVHGLIRMTDEETRIISHPLFNRLRKIKQNTFLYYVFPSANHTRFEHSIGVMHLASEMYLNAFYNVNTNDNKQDKYDDITKKENILNYDYFTKKKKYRDKFESLFFDLRIAALLHDIGHGPMSHLFDEFAPDTVDFIRMVKDDLKEKEEKSFLVALEKTSENSEKVEHELMSYYFSFIVLKSINLPIARINRILTIMNNDFKLISEKLKIGNEYYDMLPFLNHIVVGAPLDCDRMDYLLRDSYFTGVKYGNYDLDRILKSLLPFIDKGKNIIRLGIKKSGLPAIESFLHARYELFIQVYYHKTNRACNSMLIQATRELSNTGHLFVDVIDRESLINSYIRLSDEQFIDDVLKAIKNDDDKEIITDLLNRRLWKRIAEIYPEENSSRKSDIDNKLKDYYNFIVENYVEMKPFLRRDIIEDNPLKDLDKEGSVLLEKDLDQNYNPTISENWVKESARFAVLKRHFLVGRLYIRVKDDNEDKRKYRSIKRAINSLDV